MKQKITYDAQLAALRPRFAPFFDMQGDTRTAAMDKILKAACKAQRWLNRAKEANATGTPDKIAETRYFDECDVYLELLSMLKLLGLITETSRRACAEVLHDWITGR